MVFHRLAVENTRKTMYIADAAKLEKITAFHGNPRVFYEFHVGSVVLPEKHENF